MKRYSKVLAILFGLSSLCNANATLSSRDLVQGSGDKLLTYDNLTNYEWLDVTQTVDMSLDETRQNIKYGGIFYGFQIASSEDVRNLFQSGGWTGGWNNNYFSYADPSHYAEATTLVHMLGNTVSYLSAPFATYGMVSDISPAGMSYYSFILADDGSTGNPVYSAAWQLRFEQSANVPANYIGTFLYRSVNAVPEPETYVMMLGGLGLLGAISRRRKPRQST